MKPIILLAGSVSAIIICMVFVAARAEEPKVDPVLATIQADADANKNRKDYVRGFCAGLRASAWAEAQQHGWTVAEDGLVPPSVTFPDKTTFTCRKVKP